MAIRIKRDWATVTFKAEPDLFEALLAFSEREQKTVSLMCRELVREALSGEGMKMVERNLRDAGYREGYQKGLSALRVGVKKLSDAIRGEDP